MRKLQDFLVRKRHWFLFILLEIISLTLVYRNNAYQRNIMFSSANVITGHITSVSGFVTSYLNLRDINRELLERNGQLEMELLELQDQLEMMRADTALFVGFAPDSTGQFPYSFVMADVVNNSVTYLSNYITIRRVLVRAREIFLRVRALHVRRQVVPAFAGNLAAFAARALRGIEQNCHLSHLSLLPLMPSRCSRGTPCTPE